MKFLQPSVGSNSSRLWTHLEADGVAFAAIQGLNRKLEETRAENAGLKQRLEQLEQLQLVRQPAK